MQLCLVNNDPISTLLITPDGEPIFSIETPPLLYSSSQPQPKSPPASLTRTSHNDAASSCPTPASLSFSTTRRQRSPKTTIKRIQRHHRSVGQVETEIGVVEYLGPEMGTHLQMCAQNHSLDISERCGYRGGMTAKEIAESTDSDSAGKTQPPGDSGGDGFEVKDKVGWEFMGPDARRYKWQLFVHSPVLLTADSTLTPLARYRRAKIGIVSRPRRAFLEIFPAGNNLIDLIVVTFVGFMKQRVLVEGAVYETPESTPTPPVLPGRPSERSSGLITPIRLADSHH